MATYQVDSSEVIIVDSTQVEILLSNAIVNSRRYLYLQGCVGTVAGSWVTFDENGATALLAANAVGRVAIATGAVNLTTKYGWYLVYGDYATAACDAVAGLAALYIDATTGRVDDDVVAGDFVFNAYATAASAANQVAVRINEPFVTNVLG